MSFIKENWTVGVFFLLVGLIYLVLANNFAEAEAFAEAYPAIIIVEVVSVKDGPAEIEIYRAVDSSGDTLSLVSGERIYVHQKFPEEVIEKFPQGSKIGDYKIDGKI